MGPTKARSRLRLLAVSCGFARNPAIRRTQAGFRLPPVATACFQNVSRSGRGLSEERHTVEQGAFTSLFAGLAGKRTSGSTGSEASSKSGARQKEVFVLAGFFDSPAPPATRGSATRSDLRRQETGGLGAAGRGQLKGHGVGL